MGDETDGGSRGAVWTFLATPRSLRTYLVALSIALVVPLLLVSTALMVGFVRSEMQTGRDELLRDARSLSADVDRELAGLLTVLDTLATSTSLGSGDLASFHARARAALAPRNAYVLVLDTSLQQLLNTRRPYGAVLPKTSNEESARSVLRTRDVAISDFFHGAVSGRRVVNVMRPVIENGQVRYILIVTVDTDRFLPILRAGIRRDAYFVALVDKKGEALASDRTPSEALAVADASATTGIATRNIAGETWLQAAKRSDLTGWTTAISIPRAKLDGPLWRSLYLLGLSALVTLAAAASVIAFIRRRVSSSVADIRAATRQLAGGQALTPASPSVLEAVEIMGSLRVASNLVAARTRRLEESEARYRAALRLGRMGSWETDFVRGTRTWSPEAVALLDLRGSEGRVGGANDELIAAMHPEDRHLLARYHEHLCSHDDLDAEYRVVLGDGTVRRVAGRGLVISRQRNGAPHVIINVVADVTERANVEEHLSEFATNLANAKARFEALIEATAQIVWSATPDGRVVEDSPSWRAFTGQTIEQFLGHGWLDAIHPSDREQTRQAWLQAIASGTLYQVEYRTAHVGDGYRWTRARGVPLKTADGSIIGWVGMNEDIDERMKRNEHLNIVMRELSHRTKNLLAIIQSIARRSLASGTGATPRVGQFLDRLQGLAVSHDLLVHGNWTGVSLEHLVREHLKAFISSSDAAASITGPGIIIDPAAAQNIGLALHELATNAAKYGALKTDADKLRITWTVREEEGERLVDFVWKEDVHPEPSSAPRDGFGTRLLRDIVGASLGGRTSYCVSPTGVEWHLVAPLDNLSRDL